MRVACGLSDTRVRVVRLAGAAQAPEIPTFEESGVHGVEAYDSYGVLAPAGTPRAVSARLNAKIIEALNTSDVTNRFAVTQFAEVVGSTPEEFQRFLLAEAARWAKVIRDANIRAE